MNASFLFDTGKPGDLQVLSEDGDRVFCRGRRPGDESRRDSVLVVLPAAEHPPPASLERIAREYGLKDQLDGAWALRPLDLVRDRDRTLLVLEDPGGLPLDHLLGTPMEVGRFLHLAIGIAAALGKVHQQGIIHKDIKPANVLVNLEANRVWLTGFGIASRLPRERQVPEPPEFIAGTLAYMAPEQTGRMNRSIDSRSDLYALGVTFYQMITGGLPFAASDPMEWVHCHIARCPIAPAERRKEVPNAISAIIMQLLTKTAEERYQTAGGLERDLRRCLAEWEARNEIDEFPLRERDIPDRLLIPEKLYGRSREVETLLAAFDRIVKSGAPELVLVSGYSGIGKSSVVNELHKALVPPRGLFASGKFDQYKRDIPYATLAQAFQTLIRPLLGKSEAELAPWRDALREALGPNGQLMVDVVPELKLIIGEQLPAPELPPQDAQRRFQLVFRRFIGVFARPENPLALFLDDLQWLDAATLDLLEDILARSDLRHLMLIGAYRDNEVTSSHPLMRKLEAIKSAGGKVAEINLAPLAREHLGQLITDALRYEPDQAASLAELMHEKTGGNPFFALQFLSSLVEEGILTFDHDAACWSRDIERIHTKGYTDNVVDLMVGKLTRLPSETQEALQQFACLGNIADITILSLVLDIPENQVHGALWPAVAQELIERVAGAYRFVHDRIQEAAYSLIPEGKHAAAHRRIGRVLVSQTAATELETSIFEIVNQLNRGLALITDQAEREQLAEFNLMAGRRAKASAAFASALIYFVAGTTLLPEDAWERRHELTFALELHRAECEHLTGALEPADKRLAILAGRATTVVGLAAVTAVQMMLYTTMGLMDRGVAACLEFLARRGVIWSPHPTDEDIKREYDAFWQRLGDRSIEELIDLPQMVDPEWRATLDVLLWGLSPAHFTDRKLHMLMVGRMANLSIEHGNSDASPIGYLWVGANTGFGPNEKRAGFRLGRLGFDLVEKRGLIRFKAQTYFGFGNFILPWSRPYREGADMLRRAFIATQEDGDLPHAVYACNFLLTNQLAAGLPLAEVQRDAERTLEFVRQAKYGLFIDAVTTRLQLIRVLRGQTSDLSCFDDARFDERSFEARLEDDPSRAGALCWHAIHKLQAQVLSGDFAAALAAAEKAQPLLWTSPSFLALVEYHFYAALARAGHCAGASGSEEIQHLAPMRAHCDQLAVWAAGCPENFRDREVLVAAEIARIEGRDLDAEHLYEEAIGAARENGLIHHEALAYELAARFYAARGFSQFARLYLRNARSGYSRWGADGKVRQLDELYPDLGEEAPAAGSAGMIGAAVERLDLATVIEVSQAVSGEIVFEELIDTLLRTALKQAGAERGVLLLPCGDGLRVEAEATTSGDAVTVHLLDEAVDNAALPESVLHYVLRTRESVALDDAGAKSEFSADPYIRQRQARSVLCLPLLNQAKLIGVLYLENNLAPRVFAQGRIPALKLLASQAAVSLENTRLYRDLAEREAKIRRLVDANIVGIFIWDIDGRILEANDAFLRIVGYDREDLAAGGMRWTDLSPSEWLDHYAREEAPELEQTGTLAPFEKEYFRKDGSRVPVLIGAAAFDGREKQGVAFVLDLTERKRAEEALRNVQMEFTHANRVATIGQLTASIAHEVNQPIAATINNASAALRFLTHQPPNLDEVEQALEEIVRSGNRAGDVIAGVRALVKKTPPRMEPLDINEAIREVIELTDQEAVKNHVTMRLDLAVDAPGIHGDRVQLQQVVMNLIVNAIQAMATTHEGSRELSISTTKDGAGRRNCRGAGYGAGTAAGKARPSVRSFPYNQARRVGAGPFDLPLDRRSAWRTIVGGR